MGSTIARESSAPAFRILAVGNAGDLTLNQTTVSGGLLTTTCCFPDTAGGGVLNYYGTLTLTNSTVSGNTAFIGPEIQHVGRTITANNYNLFGHDGRAGVTGFSPGPTDIVPSEPLSAILDPLADNGGPTQTHALVTGSPAIDAAPVDPDCPSTDQRGVSRPQRAACDIGAFEHGAPGLTISGSCPGQVTVAISGASPGGSVALVRGSGPGSFTVPSGPCQGSVLGLEDVQLVRYLTADPNGELQGTRAVVGSECEIPLQAADLATCTASNVASIP